jgi:hypothetical protein
MRWDSILAFCCLGHFEPFDFKLTDGEIGEFGVRRISGVGDNDGYEQTDGTTLPPSYYFYKSTPLSLVVEARVSETTEKTGAACRVTFYMCRVAYNVCSLKSHFSSLLLVTFANLESCLIIMSSVIGSSRFLNSPQSHP